MRSRSLIGQLLVAVTLAAGLFSATLATADAPSALDARLQVMVEGSLNVSRTKVDARRFLAPDSVPTKAIPETAEANFRRAATFVIKNAASLPLNRTTAITINKMVTEGLVPEKTRGDPLYRLRSKYSTVTDPFVGGDVNRFYDWLEQTAPKLGPRDPIDLAEKIHYNMSALDSFPDGNGRTARLMADLALLKHGVAPASYTEMTDYFAHGNPRSPVTRDEKREYFRSIVARGQARLQSAGKKGAQPSAPAGKVSAPAGKLSAPLGKRATGSSFHSSRLRDSARPTSRASVPARTAPPRATPARR